MKYTELLTSLGRQASDMGTKVNSLIKAYLKHEGLIEKAKVERDGAKTDAKKSKLIKEIEIAEAQLIDMNEAVCDAISKYNANYELNKKKGKQLGQKAATPQPGGGGGNDPGPADPGPANVPIPPGNSDPVDDPKTDPKKEEKKKEGSGGVLLFLGILAAGVAAVFFGTRSNK